MDLIWPLTTSYRAEKIGSSIVIWVPAFMVSMCSIAITIDYNQHKRQAVVCAGSFLIEFNEYNHRTEMRMYPWIACSYDRAQCIRFVLGHSTIDNAPTDPTALAIIAAISEHLPQPIAEEIIPHLVMSLRTLTAQ